jgi:uncharacterized protein YceH (UPF0502 family)
MKTNPLLSRLRHHVTGAIERGEAVAIVEQSTVEATQARLAAWDAAWDAKFDALSQRIAALKAEMDAALRRL